LGAFDRWKRGLYMICNQVSKAFDHDGLIAARRKVETI
jgi:hypothetical protein